MTNLEKFYPEAKLESFMVKGDPLAHDPDDSRCCIDCEVCRACDFCDTDRDHKTCIDTFEAWLRKEAV